MAALKVGIGLSLLAASMVGVAAVAAGQEGARLPRNVFADSPYTRRYYMWWAPHDVIFDPDKVSAIQQLIEAIAPEEAEVVDLGRAFGPERHSGFLFPILAAQGEKGAVILERLLGEYEGRELDDEWLLIVASLGRIPIRRAEEALEAEFERVIRTGAWDRRNRRRGILSKPDARIPLIDALLACKAGQGSLSAADIEAITAGAPNRPFLAWTLGLEWARHLMSEDQLIELLECGLEGCSDADLAARGAVAPSSGRLDGIYEFLVSPKDVWPLSRRFILRRAERRKAVVDYLRLLYCGLLVLEADDTSGKYSLDPEAVAFITAQPPLRSRGLSTCCSILLSCERSEDVPEWDAFLRQAGQRLDPRDVSFVEYFVRRIHSPKGPQEADPYLRRTWSGLTKVTGVHMYGFRRPSR